MVTLSIIVDNLPLVRGAVIIDILAIAAVSLCPPDAALITPSEPDITLTLKSVSISKADNITKSNLLTAELLFPIEA